MVICNHCGFFTATKLENQLKKNEKCIYCGGELSNQGKEHIFNSSFGGKHKTSGIICMNCNQEFATTIDPPLTNYASIIMNARGFKGERHKNVPIINTTDKEIYLESGMQVKLKPKVTSIIEADSDSLLLIEANDHQEAIGELQDLLKNKGIILSKEQKKLMKSVIKKVNPTIIQRSKPFSVEMKVNYQKQYRSAAHTMMKALAFFKPEIANDLQLMSIRNFIRHGEGRWEDFAVYVEEGLPLWHEAYSTYGIYYNSVDIYFNKLENEIIGVFTLLGSFRRSIKISNVAFYPENRILSVLESVGANKIQGREIICDNERMYKIGNADRALLKDELEFIVDRTQTLDSTMKWWRDQVNLVFEKNSSFSVEDIPKISILFHDFNVKLASFTSFRLTETEVTQIIEDHDYSSIVLRYLDNQVEKKIISKLIKEIGTKILLIHFQKGHE